MNPKPNVSSHDTALTKSWETAEWTPFALLGAFIRELIANPRTVGAAFPSSRKLATRIASFIPADSEGVIVELGAGTGAVTSALLDRGIPPQRVIAIERSQDLTRVLKRRFPSLTVVHGDARYLSDILMANLGDIRGIDYVVSSLPLRSLPKSTVQAIEGQLDQVLGENGCFIQFTYDLRPDVSGPFRRFKRCASKIVWHNLPPARVDVFQRG